MTVFFNPLLRQIYILRREQTPTSDTISSQGKDMFARFCWRLRRICPPITDYKALFSQRRQKSAPTVAFQEHNKRRPFCAQCCQNASPIQLQALLCSHCLLLYRWKLSKCYFPGLFACPFCAACIPTHLLVLRQVILSWECLCSDRGSAFLLRSQRCGRREHF